MPWSIGIGLTNLTKMTRTSPPGPSSHTFRWPWLMRDGFDWMMIAIVFLVENYIRSHRPDWLHTIFKFFILTSCSQHYWPLSRRIFFSNCRTFVDESGFLVTKKELVSCSEEDEPEPSPPKKVLTDDPPKAVSTTTSSPSKVNKKQSSIRNFFTKKWP